METDSIVVMESGADWPTWVDQEAGAVSNVVILARQPRESIRAFGTRTERTERRLDSLSELAAPRRGDLVCGPERDADSRSCRVSILKALASVVRRAGGGEIVLVGEDRAALIEVEAHLAKLNRREGIRVGMRLCPPPAARALRVA
jgi:hypothetical protein